MMYRVNIEFKPTKIQLLSGIASFNTGWVLDKQKFMDWVYKEPIIIDPAFSPSYQDETRQKMRENKSFSYASNFFKVIDIKISTNIDSKEMDNEKLKNVQSEYVEVACLLNEECEKVSVSFLIDVDLYEGIHRLFKNSFVITNDWLIEEKAFPSYDYSLKEEYYQELISKEIDLVIYGYTITQKDSFLRIMNPSLYKKYALLRN